MTTDEVKTAEEIAKATKKGLEVVEKAGQFIAKVFGDTFYEVGQITLGQVRLYRHRNLLRIADKVETIHKQRKLERKTKICLSYKQISSKRLNV